MFAVSGKTLGRITGSFIDFDSLNAVSATSHGNYNIWQAAWMHRFQRHYPGQYKEIVNQISDLSTVNWKYRFNTLCEQEFAKFNTDYARLCFSARDDDLTTFKNLIQDRDFGYTLIWSLIKYATGNQRILDYLYNRMPIDRANIKPLHWAIYCRQSLDFIDLLIKKYPQEAFLAVGKEAFAHAIRCGNFEVIQHLIKKYAIDIHAQHVPHPWLILAVLFEQEDIVKFLLQEGVDINQANQRGHMAGHDNILIYMLSGDRALDVAIRVGNVSIVNLLIANGAELKATHLHAAAKCRNYEVIKYFLDYDPRLVNIMDEHSNLPLTLYLDGARDERITYAGYKLFYDYGAEFVTDTRNEANQSWLYSATVQGDLRIVRHLLANGVNPDLSPHDGNPPLYIAIKTRNDRLADLLLSYGAAYDTYLEHNSGIILRDGGHLPLDTYRVALKFANAYIVRKFLLGTMREEDQESKLCCEHMERHASAKTLFERLCCYIFHLLNEMNVFPYMIYYNFAHQEMDNGDDSAENKLEAATALLRIILLIEPRKTLTSQHKRSLSRIWWDLDIYRICIDMWFDGYFNFKPRPVEEQVVDYIYNSCSIQ